MEDLRYISKIYWSKNKGRPPGAPFLMSHAQLGSSASSCCRRSPASGPAGQHLSPPSPGRGPGLKASMPRTHSPEPPLFLFGPQLHCSSACVNAEEKVSGPLLSFYYISLGWGKSKLSFKLSNPIPGCSRICGLILSDIFLIFSQARLLLFLVIILAPTFHAS